MATLAAAATIAAIAGGVATTAVSVKGLFDKPTSPSLPPPPPLPTEVAPTIDPEVTAPVKESVAEQQRKSREVRRRRESSTRRGLKLTKVDGSDSSRVAGLLGD